MNADNSYSKTVLNDVTSSDLELTDDEPTRGETA